MTTDSKIDVKFEGSFIRVGVNKLNNNVYIQPVDKTFTNLWFLFDKEHYKDYSEYLKDYEEFEHSVTNILDDLTLSNYIRVFDPNIILINDETVYNKGFDTSYTVTDYVNDMINLAKFNFYPVICKLSMDFEAKKLTIDMQLKHIRG